MQAGILALINSVENATDLGDQITIEINEDLRVGQMPPNLVTTHKNTINPT